MTLGNWNGPTHNRPKQEETAEMTSTSFSLWDSTATQLFEDQRDNKNLSLEIYNWAIHNWN